jgi:hypothetical protein
VTHAFGRAFDLRGVSPQAVATYGNFHSLFRARPITCSAQAGIPMAQDHAADHLDHPREGRYANHFHIGYNAFEMILQFGQFYEGNTQPVMHTTIITSPAYAENLLHLLNSTLAQYKESFADRPDRGAHE